VIYQRALASGSFTEVRHTGSLRVLERIAPASAESAGGAGPSSRRAAALPGLTSDAGATKERRRSEEGRQRA
jgi:hypothetical protein